MNRLITVLVGVLCVLAIGFAVPVLDSMAQQGTPEASPEGSPVASPIASPVGSPIATPEVSTSADDLEGMILDLEATVSAQADDIAALQTQVADLAAVQVTPEDSGGGETIGEAETHDLVVVITLRARHDEVTGTDVGEECAGAGRWDDLGPDTQITLSDEDGNVLATGELDTSKIVFSGQLFRECQLTYTLTDVESIDEYQFEIPGRSSMTLSADDLESADWQIELTYGP